MTPRHYRATSLLAGRWISVCLAGSLVACAHDGQLHPPLPGREGQCAFTAERHEIVCGGDRIARVRCHQPSTPVEGACRALALEYLSDGSVVWLYKSHGDDPDDPSAGGARQYDVAAAYFTLVAS